MGNKRTCEIRPGWVSDNMLLIESRPFEFQCGRIPCGGRNAFVNKSGRVLRSYGAGASPGREWTAWQSKIPCCRSHVIGQ